MIGRSGSIGGGQYIKTSFWPLNTTLWVKDFHGNDPRFCYYLLKSIDFKQFNVGSGVPTLNRNHIHPLPVFLPSLEQQQGIAAFLGALDDQIDLLRHTNTTLEAITQAIFRSWFIDFDPVKAKSEGRTPDGIDEATAALFPDSFEESALGAIPKGWAVRTIDEVASVVKGKSYKSSELVDDHHTALVTLKSFRRGGGFRMDGFKPYTGAYKPDQVVMAGDVVLAYTDVTQAAELIARPAIVIGVNRYTTLVASLDVGVVRTRPGGPGKLFLYGRLNTADFLAHALGRTSGTTVLHLAKDGVGAFSFACPPASVSAAFEQIAAPLVEQIQCNLDEVQTLTELRDTLLPRLISGKLKLPELKEVSETI